MPIKYEGIIYMCNNLEESHSIERITTQKDTCDNDFSCIKLKDRQS